MTKQSWSTGGLRNTPKRQPLGDADARASKLRAENERRKKRGLPPVRPKATALTREEAVKSVARTFLEAAYPDLTVEELEQKQCAFVDKALDPQRIYKYDPVELD